MGPDTFQDVYQSESEVLTVGRHEKDAHVKRLMADSNVSIRLRFRLHSHINATIDYQTCVSAALAVRPSSGERLQVPLYSQAFDRTLSLDQANTYRHCEYTLSTISSPLDIITTSPCLTHGNLLTFILMSSCRMAEIDRYGR